MPTGLLAVVGLEKHYRRSALSRETTFRLAADFSVAQPMTVGVLGANGSGKTTLFELITGSNLPNAGQVFIDGQDIHRVRYRERCRLAIHYHQSYQVRKIKRRMPSFLLERARRSSPLVHLFDEPQLNLQDGYIGFILKFFCKLRQDGRVVFLCLHPTEPYQLDVLRDACERFIFVRNGALSIFDRYDTLLENEHVRAYLGALAQGR
jgi:ABC-type branched-subunit amino acid transport system ATPase component